MWKMTLAYCLLFAGVSVAATAPRFPHHPFALIGDDHGVLTEEDLAINACEGAPEPFSPSSTVYPYWQCFKTTDVSILCDPTGYDETEKSEMAILVFSEKTNDDKQEYLSRRPIFLSGCKTFRKSWLRLSKGLAYACFSGSFIKTGADNSGEKVTSWIFDRFKTLRGCVSYFVGDCSLSYQIKNGCS